MKRQIFFQKVSKGALWKVLCMIFLICFESVWSFTYDNISNFRSPIRFSEKKKSVHRVVLSSINNTLLAGHWSSKWQLVWRLASKEKLFRRSAAEEKFHYISRMTGKWSRNTRENLVSLENSVLYCHSIIDKADNACIYKSSSSLTRLKDLSPKLAKGYL